MERRHGSAPVTPVRPDGGTVPPVLRLASEWTWRLLVVALGLYGITRVLGEFADVVIALLVAMLITALLYPLVELLARHRVPRALATFLSMLLGFLVVAGLIALVSQQAATGFSDLRDQAIAGLGDLQSRLANSRLHLTSRTLNDLVSRAQTAATNNRGAIVSGALGAASTVTHVVEGFFIALFATFFFLSSGRRIWAWLLRMLPGGAQEPLDDAGRSGFVTLTHYVRATLIVATVDGVGVGIGIALLGVPLAFPLAVVVFLGAFIPVVGALLSGVVAVLVALVTQGPYVALAVVGVLLAVNQLEAHILQPFLLGRAVEVHPLAVILSLAVGAAVAGVLGALFAVPLAAVANTMITSIAQRGQPKQDPGEQVDQDPAPLAPDRPEQTDLTEPTDLPEQSGAAPDEPEHDPVTGVSSRS